MRTQRFILTIITCFFLGVQGNMWAQDTSKNQVQFTGAFDDFPRKEKDLRKWDNPVVTDLDLDGWPDLVLNDHGLGISVCWNNEGKFAKPYDVIMGDLHGVTVGDFDKEGHQELIVSRGGGSGSNARNAKIYRITKEREFVALPDFEVPLEFMRGRTVKLFDGDNDGDLDLLNFAFPSKEKKGKSESYIYGNNSQRELVLKSKLPPSIGDGQKTLITDYNGDGIIDMLLYGHGTVQLYKGTGNLTFEEVTKKILPFELTNVTSIGEIDFDNDGDFDLYFTRGREFEIGETFYNEELKTWGFFTKRGAFQFEDLKVGDILQLRNFQSQWPYNDAYYIGESGYQYDFPGETHSGKDIRLVNSNALGFPDRLNKKGGVHVGYVGNDKWRIAGNTWSPTTGTVEGVLEYPKYNHPLGLQDFLLENRKGKFFDITKKANVFFEEHTVGCSIADFDNNGHQDILVIKRGNLVFENSPTLYLNQGDFSFMQVPYPGLSTFDSGSVGMAVEVLDYDLDGDIDVVIGNERGKWHLFKNELETNREQKSITLQIGHSPTEQANPLGALVKLKTCVGTQTKRVGSSAARYSLSYDTKLHFGLGNCTKSMKVEVFWTNGEKTQKTISTGKTSETLGSLTNQ